MKSVIDAIDRSSCKDVFKEIISYKGNIQTLSSLFVDIYCKYFLSRNIDVLNIMTDTINAKSRKDLSKVIIFCCLYRKNEEHFQSRKVDIYDIICIYAELPIMKQFRHFTSEECCKYFAILKTCLKHNEKDNIKKMLDFLLQFKEPVAQIDYEEINHVTSDLKNDIVWFLWKILIDVTKSDWCRQSLNLFSFNYKRKCKKTRINLLYFCYLNHTKVKNKNLEIENYFSKYSQFIEILDSKPNKTKKKKTELDYSKTEESDLKTDYLKFLTYKDEKN